MTVGDPSEFISPVWVAYIFVIGACVGSFLNVVIYRLPKKESLITPGSHCPSCGNKVRPFHNIPMVGYLLLVGKCADCREPISARYPLVEFLTALLFTASLASFGLTPTAFVYMGFCSALIAVTFIDLDHFIIPDSITLPGIVIGLLLTWLVLPLTINDAMLGIGVGAGFFWILALLVPQGMGGGDIKLIAMVGSFIGLKGTLFTIFLGSLFGSILGIIGIAVFGKSRKSKIPFGPFLAIGGLMALFWEEQLTRIYFDIFVK